MKEEKIYVDDELKSMFCNDMSELFRDIIIQCKAESVEHLWYVREYTRILTETYAKLYPRSRLTKRKREYIVKASVLHDLGKIAIPDFILDKPGHLSLSEMEILKKHTIKGSRIIKSMSWQVERDFSKICYNVCLYHHEKNDGSGYPYGLRGDKIPIEAQIVGLADMYDVLIHGDVNREPMEKSKAYYMLMNGKCGELSPKMRECFDDSRQQMEEMVFSGGFYL